MARRVQTKEEAVTVSPEAPPAENDGPQSEAMAARVQDNGYEMRAPPRTIGPLDRTAAA
jgi:hypothetical protein